MSDEYKALEPHHRVEVDEQGRRDVWCPFEVAADGSVVLHDQPVTLTITWSADESDDIIDCPVCEVFNDKLHFAGSPDCEDEDA